MSFVSELRNNLVNTRQVYDLSRNKDFWEFNFIGFKETAATIDFVAFVRADKLTERQIVKLRDSFFKITQIVSYNFGLKPLARNPNGLLCFVFEDHLPNQSIDFIKKQRKISNFEKSAVIVSWAIDVKQKQIHTHNNPVSFVPPVYIVEKWVFPGLDYLKSFLYAYNYQSTHVDNNTEVSVQSFKRLERKMEEIEEVIKAIPNQYQHYSQDAKVSSVIQTIYAIGKNNINVSNMDNTGDTYNVSQAGAVGKYARADHNKFYSQQTKPLVEAAAEIQELLKQLEQSNPTANKAQRIAYVNDETTPSFKRRAVSALQAGSESAIEEVLDNSYVNIVKAIIIGWINPE